jgi:uncharacterized protein (DUF2249 family)/iron-sulfur cluster repair protein YtfE (RIC family)
VNAAARELDVRPLAPRDRAARCIEAFDRLPEGESLVLIDDHDPRALFHLLRFHRGDRLGWLPTRRGPREWRIDLRRLRPKALETGLRAYFSREHGELRTLVEHLRSDLRATRRRPGAPLEPLRARFDELERELERRLRTEEEDLLRRVERKIPALALGAGATARAQHAAIRQCVGVASNALGREPAERRDLARAAKSLELLARLLEEHHRTEDRQLFAELERCFDSAALDELLDLAKEAASRGETGARSGPEPNDPLFVDLRDAAAAERPAALERAFARLDEGESFLLVTEEDPRALVEAFRRGRADRAGVVSFARLGGEWRLEIQRFPPRARVGSLHGVLARDHQEIDVLLAFVREDLRAGAAAGEGERAELARRVALLAARLVRHSRWEERVLFPSIEAKIPTLARGLGHVMRMEHREIRRLLARALRALRAGKAGAEGFAASSAAVDAILELLREHHEKEEYVHYAVADRMFREDEREELVARLLESE